MAIGAGVPTCRAVGFSIGGKLLRQGRSSAADPA